MMPNDTHKSGSFELEADLPGWESKIDAGAPPKAMFRFHTDGDVSGWSSHRTVQLRFKELLDVIQSLYQGGRASIYMGSGGYRVFESESDASTATMSLVVIEEAIENPELRKLDTAVEVDKAAMLTEFCETYEEWMFRFREYDPEVVEQRWYEQLVAEEEQVPEFDYTCG